MPLHTLKTFDSSIEAHILRSRLANEGIVSFIFDEQVMTLNPLYNITVGGVKLKVLEDDLERAKEVLSEMERLPFRTEDDKVVVCPACGSKDLYHGFKSTKGIAGILSMILSLFLVTYPIYHKTVYRCKVCGTEFKTGPVE